MLLALAACSTIGVRNAQVDEHSTRGGEAAPVAAGSPTPPVAPAIVSAPPAGRGPIPPSETGAGGRTTTEGLYLVRRGDTLYGIAQAFGRDWHDIARWNNLGDATHLDVGLLLRLVPPNGNPAPVAAPAGNPGRVAGPAGAPVAEAMPLDRHGAAVAGPSAGLEPAPPVASPPAAPNPPTPWVWPLGGRLLATFDERKNKGIEIQGHVGEGVVAAQDGTVVYTGSGLPSYGNLVILKHADELISAYAYNRQIFVSQGQEVKRGQKIAELGQVDQAQPRLHFEVRRQGKPIDPLSVLPPR